MNTNVSFNLYIFNDDQSATIVETPVIDNIDPIIPELTDEHLREIVRYFYSDKESNGFDIEEITTWSYEKLAQVMWDDYGLTFNWCAIIPAGEEDKIKVAGEMLGKMMSKGGDSLAYMACEMFATLLKESATKLIPFPESNRDLYYKDME